MDRFFLTRAATALGVNGGEAKSFKKIALETALIRSKRRRAGPGCLQLSTKADAAVN